jgi:hypothetical protein
MIEPGPEIVFRPVLQKRQFNIHTKGQFEMKLKFFFVSESASVTINKELLQKIFSGPFSATLGTIRPQILPANFIFPWPLLSFLEEILAAWQH